MSEIGAVAILAAIVAIPLSFLVRCGGAIFSQATRERIKDNPGTHIVWLLLALAAGAYLIIGWTMACRKAADHQRRIAEQHGGRISSEGTPSAPPNESSP